MAGGHICKHKIARYLKLKKDDRLLVSSVFWDGIRSKRQSSVRKARPDFNSDLACLHKINGFFWKPDFF